MKKIFVLLIAIILLAGCSNKSVLKKEMEKVTNIYYQEYIKDKVKGLDTLEISLGDIRKIKSIDVSKLKSCSDDTKVKATINNKKIKKYEISLICK